MATPNENGRKSDMCDIDVHKVSIPKHLKAESIWKMKILFPLTFFEKSNESDKIKLKKT